MRYILTSSVILVALVWGAFYMAGIFNS